MVAYSVLTRQGGDRESCGAACTLRQWASDPIVLNFKVKDVSLNSELALPVTRLLFGTFSCIDKRCHRCLFIQTVPTFRPYAVRKRAFHDCSLLAFFVAGHVLLSLIKTTFRGPCLHSTAAEEVLDLKSAPNLFLYSSTEAGRMRMSERRPTLRGGVAGVRHSGC